MPTKRWIVSGLGILLIGAFLRSLTPISTYSGPKGIADAATAARLRRTVETLAVKIGERNHNLPNKLSAAEAFVRKELSTAGYEVHVQQYPVTPPGWPKSLIGRNFEVVVPAAAPDAPVLVIGAHYDSAPSTPGADDNASGTAVLLELARRFHGKGGGSAELRFVAFGTEEPPYFWTDQMGSVAHARALRKEGRRVLGMASLEMLGFYSDEPGSQRYPRVISWFYPKTADFIAVVGTWGKSSRFLRRFASGLKPPAGTRVLASRLPRLVREINLSDHASYWKEGFPAVMVTDTSFLRYADYHALSDTPEKLDYARMADVTTGLEAAILSLLGRR